MTSNRADCLKLIQKVNNTWSIVEPEDESTIRFLDEGKSCPFDVFL